MEKIKEFSNNGRLEWLDVAKSIAIILMVVGHTSIPKVANDFIFAFHMPLFYIASGWTTNWSKYTFVEFLKRRCCSLLIPFFIYSAIVLLIQVVHGWITFDYWLCKGWGDGYALWFIPVLFLSCMLVKALYSFRKVLGGGAFWLTTILFLFIGIDLHHYHILLPWSLSTVPYAVFMIVVGSEWGKTQITLIPKKEKVLLAGLSVLLVVFVSHFYRLDLCFNRISPVLPPTIGALAGTYMIFTFSRVICDTKGGFCLAITSILRKVGTETYVVVAFSPIIIMLINHYVSINAITKYIVLTIILVLICIVKYYIITIYQNSRYVSVVKKNKDHYILKSIDVS